MLNKSDILPEEIGPEKLVMVLCYDTDNIKTDI